MKSGQRDGIDLAATGLGMLVAGSRWLVNGAVAIAACQAPTKRRQQFMWSRRYEILDRG